MTLIHKDDETSDRIKGRDEAGRAVRTPEQRRKDHEAAGWRLKGLTFVEIGDKMGVTDSGAYYMVERAWKDVRLEDTEQLVKTEIAKIDYLEQKAHEILTKNHAYVSAGGKVVYDDGVKLEDDGPVLQAIQVLSKLAERRAKLLGLNAPTRTELTSTVSVSIEDKSEQAKGSVLSLLARLSDE